jgi:hypothetical protein
MADSPFDGFTSDSSSTHHDDPFAEHSVGLSSAPSQTHHDEHDDDIDDVTVESKSSAPSSAHEDDPFASVSSSSSSEAPSLDPLAGVDQKSLGLPDPHEETAYTQWEKERAKILSERAAKADETKKELLQSAKEDLDKFYADLDGKISRTQKQNRIDEKNYKADLTALMANGTKWEKVAKFANLTARTADKAGSISRVDRMRKLLITLKAQREEQK